MVEVTDLHVHFGAVRALTGVSFVARDGAPSLDYSVQTAPARPPRSTSSVACASRCADRSPLMADRRAIHSIAGVMSARCSTTRDCIRGSPPARMWRTTAH